MTIDAIFKRFLKEEGLYLSEFRSRFGKPNSITELKCCYVVDLVYYLPWGTILRKKPYTCQQRYKNSIFQKWERRARNIRCQHNIECGDDIVAKNGEKYTVRSINSGYIRAISHRCGFVTPLSIKNVKEIVDKKLFKNYYYTFRNKVYGKLEGDFKEIKVF